MDCPKYHNGQYVAVRLIYNPHTERYDSERIPVIVIAGEWDGDNWRYLAKESGSPSVFDYSVTEASIDAALKPNVDGLIALFAYIAEREESRRRFQEHQRQADRRAELELEADLADDPEYSAFLERADLDYDEGRLR